MTDLRKAAEMALETLCVGANDAVPNDIDERFEQAIQALRKALAQPEQEQKTPLKVLNLTVFTETRLRNGRVYDVETLQAMTNRDILAIPDMGKKALKEVMEALDVYAVNMSQERVDETAKREHEPVGYIDGMYGGYMVFTPLNPSAVYLNGTALYTAPPKREWVGLTDVEIMGMTCECVDDGTFNMDCARDFANRIEAKLKEKNA